MGLFLLPVIGIGLARSSLMSINARDLAVRNSTASQIAMDTLEQYSSKDPVTLTANDSISDTVLRKRERFARTIKIVVNADTSRTISVDVASSTPRVRGTASLSIQLAPWGSATGSSLSSSSAGGGGIKTSDSAGGTSSSGSGGSP